ncbi:MAG: hypothetical protein ACTHVE_07800 [Senegalia sp. (in: firmicutes)]|uniref:hypothetical protein n=1 Tax=Senegalia sp. (in: firmicutes) TaxID=1924098 RepID=UPI003F9DEBDC
MSSKVRDSIVIIIILFLLGNVLVFTGFVKGADMAFSLIGPQSFEEEEWYVPDGMILGSTYVPVIIGISLIILSIIFSTVLFIDWYKKDINKTKE